jgi:hypothetical protein
VSRVEHRVVGNPGQPGGQRLVHLLGIPAGQIGPAAPVEEEGVTGDQAPVDQEALASRGVARGVDQGDGDRAHPDDVLSPVGDELSGPHTRRPEDPRRLIDLHVHRHRHQLEQPGDALDPPTHEVAAYVVGVIVGGQGADALHAVGPQDPEQLVDAVGGVDDQCLPGLPVADQVDEVRHLPGDLIVHGEVLPGQQLAKVQTVRARGARGLHVGVGHIHTLRSSTPPEPLEGLRGRRCMLEWIDLQFATPVAP